MQPCDSLEASVTAQDAVVASAESLPALAGAASGTMGTIFMKTSSGKIFEVDREVASFAKIIKTALHGWHINSLQLFSG